MEEVNIFLTQERSEWFVGLLEQQRNNIGYEKESWTTRAMIALGPAGLEGKCRTVKEIELLLAPYVGLSENRHSLNNMARRAMARGIMTRTGRKRYVEGTRNPYPEYEIHGHLEIDTDGSLHSVGGVRKPNKRHDARAGDGLQGTGKVRSPCKTR